MRAISCSPFGSTMPFWLRITLFVMFAARISSDISIAQEPDSFDVRLFRLVNSQQNPDKNGFFEILDHLAYPAFIGAPAGFLASGAINENSQNFQTGIMLLVSEGLTLAGTGITKTAVDRPRPFEALEGVKVKHAWSAPGRSFPSGHSSLAFSIATIVSLQYGKASVSVPLFVWATLTAYGRVYLGVHYPTDVLAGAVLGTGVSLLVWQYRDSFADASDDILGISDPVTAAAMSGRPVGISLISLKIPIH